MTKGRSEVQKKLKKYGLFSSAWPICYSSAVVITQSYLLYQGISRYLIYRRVLPNAAVYHLCVICIAAILVPLIVLLSFVRLGSYTNDAIQVGYGLLKKELSDSRHPSRRRFHLGAPPLAIIIHIVCAYILLIADLFAVAKGKQLGKFTDSSHGKAALADMTPLSMIINTTNSSNVISIPSSNFELANFLLSLIIYLYRSVAVFWNSNRLFTLIYWSQSVAAAFLHVISYLGLQVLYTELLTTKDPHVFILNEAALITLYMLGNCVLFMSSWCIFHFGYGEILDKIRTYLRQLGHHSAVTSDYGAYIPHVLALSSILLYVGCNAPIMYDYVSMYKDTKSQLLIAHLISCVIYMLLWIIIWFLFTVKQNWDFKFNEIALKRHAILQNRLRFFSDSGSNVHIEENGSCDSTDLRIPVIEPYANSEDNISNSTTSTNNGTTPRSNGILSSRGQKRKSSEQKVKFQEATKIVIETNLDSDLDTIPESDTECADSAMFSGSGGSNDSNESQNTQSQNMNNSFSKGGKPNYKDLILNPKNIELLTLSEKQPQQQQQRRMWSSTGELSSINASKHPAKIDNRPKSVVSEQYNTTSSTTTPYSPRDHTQKHFLSSCHKQLFDDPGMSSAV